MGWGFRVEWIPFLRAMGQPESPTSGGMGARDEGEGFEVGDSPNSWIIGLFVRVLWWWSGLERVSVSGMGLGRGLWWGLRLTETSEIGDSTTEIGRIFCMTWASWIEEEK